MKKAYLVLENGDVFEGQSMGVTGSTVGELVFTTGMCGYLETLTDPSYYGQIVMQTYPLIGNYGVIPADFEGECRVKGYVVRQLCDNPSNFRCEGELDAFLKQKGIVGICGVDTRAITRIIRENGVMNATICQQVPQQLEDVRNYRITGAVQAVTCAQAAVVPAAGQQQFRVALLDYGAKHNIVRELCKRGCTVEILPGNTSAQAVLETQPDGIMLSNGPGDPAENEYAIAQLKLLMGKLPIFGICLGHQLLALANGAKTEKLKYGHRGVNQPVRELCGTRTYITSQNHGYAVVPDSLAGTKGKMQFVNANDLTCEGIEYAGEKAFSVQFHPEACSGPQDTAFLFDRFISLMKDGGTQYAVR